MQKTVYVCDGCNKESDKMLGIAMTFVEHPLQTTRSASVHVCSEECIPTAVKKAMFVAKEQTGVLISGYQGGSNLGGYFKTSGLSGLVDSTTGGEILYGVTTTDNTSRWQKYTDQIGYRLGKFRKKGK